MTPDRCSGPEGGCGGAADASLSVHALAANVASPPLLLPLLLRPLSSLLLQRLLPASLVSSGVGGHLESVCRGRQREPRGEGEGGQPGAVRDGSGRFSELAEEEEAGEVLRLPGWGSKLAGTKVGCPSGVDQRCGCC